MAVGPLVVRSGVAPDNTIALIVTRGLYIGEAVVVVADTSSGLAVSNVPANAFEAVSNVSATAVEAVSKVPTST